ncbi:hypothetical protein CLROS_044150 [Clostridium felsineum]|uniref:Uncharacterized protein n=1 Tax=Clostridium felsineum TaxID=36839 RepID=A0A1S8L3W7_9CLOT|nr:hypothetical protein CLAUR_026900 [Clostridium felsineum]URZ09011.1 hypothetical protein CLROS_044150 [Clostridium felsineum]URZ09639.1 hypothetical protein CROST_003200 [Clostridium felsineum]URZ18446.1 hypothetical protein CLFE_045340 [Clostridium felsineum DSM 794]
MKALHKVAMLFILTKEVEKKYIIVYANNMKLV